MNTQIYSKQNQLDSKIKNLTGEFERNVESYRDQIFDKLTSLSRVLDEQFNTRVTESRGPPLGFTPMCIPPGDYHPAQDVIPCYATSNILYQVRSSGYEHVVDACELHKDQILNAKGFKLQSMSTTRRGRFRIILKPG